MKKPRASRVGCPWFYYSSLLRIATVESLRDWRESRRDWHVPFGDSGQRDWVEASVRINEKRLVYRRLSVRSGTFIIGTRADSGHWISFIFFDFLAKASHREFLAISSQVSRRCSTRCSYPPGHRSILKCLMANPVHDGVCPGAGLRPTQSADLDSSIL